MLINVFNYVDLSGIITIHRKVFNKMIINEVNSCDTVWFFILKLYQ